MRALLAGVALLWAGCTLVNREQPNAPPAFGALRAEPQSVRRGGRVRLQVPASDEDYDPLYFRWAAFRGSPELLADLEALAPAGRCEGADQLAALYARLAIADTAGGFASPTAATTNVWTAPDTIQGAAEQFVLVVIVRDQDCDAIVDPAARLACVTGPSQAVHLFPVTVTQRPPIVVLPADTAVSFAAGAFALEAEIRDPDDDPLQVRWERLAGPELPYSATNFSHGSRLRATPLYVGEHVFALTVSDGADSICAETKVRVYADPEPPAGGMVDVAPPGSAAFAIDRYEYPNQRGVAPLLADSWFAAARTCAAQGKRLCTPAEWAQACGGRAGRRFSSREDGPPAVDGANFGHRFCNTAGSGVAAVPPDPLTSRAPAGTFPNCASDYGAYDLTGNVREWVGGTDDQGRMVGGATDSDVADDPPDECSSISEFAPLPAGFDYLDPSLGSEEPLPAGVSPAYRQPGVGFRCCR